MSRRLVRSMVVAVPLVCLTSATAHADPPTAPPPPPPPWAWTVVAASVAVGSVVTVASLAMECPAHDLECARWTSLGIWGGIGIASVGALVGLLVITAASRPPPVRVSFTVDRSQPGSSTPHATFGYAF